MSSLTTTTINTVNGTTNLTATTGNTTGPAIVVSSGENVWIRANSTANVFVTNTTATIINSAATVNSTFTVSGNATFNSNVTINANTTMNRMTANTVATVNGSVSTNTFTLGASLASSTGYTRLPNGLLMQWGTIQANTTVGAVTFPAAFFPVYSMTATANDKSTTCMAAITALTNTTATILLSSNTSQRTVYWQAIGL